MTPRERADRVALAIILSALWIIACDLAFR